jgi:hypothetical protein
MRSSSLAIFFASLSTIALGVIACGSSSDDGAGGASSGTSSSGASSNGSLGSEDGGNGGIDGSAFGDGEACAAQTANADRKPAHLFFILDQSYSMVTPDAQRWPRVTSAFKAFLNDPLSKGVSASLEMFPARNNDRCKTSAYASLDVGLTELPGGAGGSGPFESFLNASPSMQTAATPTFSVLAAMAPQAKAHAVANPNVKTAIVFMTDGTPQGCEDNGDEEQTIDKAAAEVAKVKDVAPTYVIGVGSNLQNLDKIALEGGTTSAIIIDDTNGAASAAQKFQAAIETIRGKTLSCDFDIPPAPAGQELDLQRVNVSYTTGAGAKQGLGYDEACAASGWKFDAPTAPTKIILCPAMCDTIKADPSGVVGVEFGCQRRDVVR